ncbi:CheR family methyltransferase [Novosphingobium mangrovi (ex Huang et al. 2023)]|uniref:Chemotaxis protein methyltransferase n=1 Tax=Novosphingobium mangrovi (ex Huang et al. 2023) TaxID=2976432 RepID=A0ABT2I4T0_9SPHN|nr:protein-glutamate O-methyltransferase CheR [Novosphingobium mangrovi (ex Huang et al. 2023)]MCT2399818.1 protein-glutamate O-methyltransferase CheR [Novosphingobium mangrovi (ex Huang et al. 2023)]
MNALSASTDWIPGVSPDIYSADDFAEIAKIIYGAAGIVLPKGKAMLVYSRLAPLVRASASVTFSKYIELMCTDGAELNKAVAALTTNHTFFYREAHHFDHLRNEIRPRVIEKLRNRQPVRLWSAGCSSGEETWSIVMTLLGPDRSAGIDMTRADLRVLATDIAPHAIDRAQAATYPAKDLKPVPEDLRRAWTTEKDDQAVMSDAMRSIVRFRLLNLLDDWPIRGKFDFIFCRNVMIYFDNPTKERLVKRFCDVLSPNGFLYIGHSERVTGPAANDFHLVGPTIYRRRAA